MHSKIKTLLAALVAGSFLLTSTPVFAQAAVPESVEKSGKQPPQPAKSPRAYPFNGTVGSVDKAAMTFTLKTTNKERVIGLVSESKIEKDGKPATLADIRPGDYAKGQLRKKDDGTEVVAKAAFGPQPPPKEKSKKPKKDAAATEAQ